MADTSPAGSRAPTYPDLAGKVAVITGSSRGIGAATCRMLAANGVKVGVNGRDEVAIARVVNGIRAAGGEAIGVVADCTSFAAIEQLRERVEEVFGPADILAAFVGSEGRPVASQLLSEEQWNTTISANLTATFLTLRSFLPGMIERRHGAIITMASSAGRLPGQASAAYAAAKAGVIMLSRHLARELGTHGIRVNCVAPSAVLTESSGLHGLSETQLQQVAAQFPLGRIGIPDDVAQATLFLASESASWLTGITLDVAGGRIIV